MSVWWSPMQPTTPTPPTSRYSSSATNRSGCLLTMQTFNNLQYHGAVSWSWQQGIMAAGVSKQLGLCGASNNTQLEQALSGKPGQPAYKVSPCQKTDKSRDSTYLVLQHDPGRQPLFRPDSPVGLYPRISPSIIHRSPIAGLRLYQQYLHDW